MNVKLAKLIVEKGYLTLDNLKTAVEEQKNTDKSLGIILIEHAFITEQQLLEITNYENEFDTVDLNTLEIPEKVIKLIPVDSARNNNLIPFELNGSFLSVAMLDPTNIVLIDELRFLTGYNIKPYIALYSGIRNALNKYYNTEPGKEVKLESVDLDNDYGSRSNDLSVNTTGDPQTNPDINQEPSVDQQNYTDQQDISVSEEVEVQQTKVVKDISAFKEGESFNSTGQEKSVDAEASLENKKILDKIDIFNLSPDEIEESRTYTTKNSGDAVQSNPQDFNLSGFQAPTEIEAAAPSNLPEDTSSADINNYNHFQAPPENIKKFNEEDDKLFEAPAARQPEKTDESHNLYMAPDTSNETIFSRDISTEKEFGIPFTFEPDKDLPELEPESEQNFFITQDPNPDVQRDPFTAFSGKDLSSSQSASVESVPSVDTEEISEDNKSEDELKKPDLKLEHGETDYAGKPSVNEDNLYQVFQSSISKESEKVEMKASEVPEQKKVLESERDELISQSTDIELDSINVDTSYDNIESLNNDLQQQESRQISEDLENESHVTQTVTQQEVNVSSSPDNGNVADSTAESEKIMQLEDDLQEQDDDIVRPTVLVVDDSPTVQKIVSVTLNRRGYNVEVSSNAMQALAKLNDCIPDIIFLDINLPHMDGYQLCKVIKSNELTKTIPVVMLSGKDGFFDKMRGKMVGATDYITKPFEPSTLVNAIEKQGITIARTN